MKMHSKHKRIATVLLSAMVMTCNALSFQAPISTASAAHAALAEDAVPFDSVDGLDDGSYSPDKVVVLLKQAYSRKYNRLLKKIFSDPMFKGYEVLSDPETENYENFRLYISANLNSTGAGAVQKALDYLKSFDEIYYAGPNQIYDVEVQAYPNNQEYPNDPAFTNNGFQNKEGKNCEGKPAYDLIDLDKAWDITRGDADFVVANSECLYYNHEDLSSQMWVNPYPTTNELHGMLYNDANPYPNGGSVYSDVSGVNAQGKEKNHGTLTAGVIIAEGNNQKGGAGVAQGCKLMAAVAAGDDNFRRIITFLNNNNVKVLNISTGSWGGPTAKICEAIKAFNGLIVISAGNNSTNIDVNPDFPASYANPDKFASLGYSASERNQIAQKVIAVGAVTYSGTLQYYSNYGTNTVTIAAPSDVVTTRTFRPDGQPNADVQSDYMVGGGTSCAAPVVAGVISLIWSANPTLTPQQVRSTLMNSADYNSYLSGKIQNCRIVNAYRALKYISADKGTYFFRSKANGRYLDLNTSNNTLIAHDFNANNNQKFKFENGVLQTLYNSKYITSGYAYNGGFKTSVSNGNDDIAIAKNMSGDGFRIMKTVRVGRNNKEEVDVYALEVLNPSSAASEVIWKKYNPNSANQIWYVEDAIPVTLPYGIYKITNASGKVLSLNQSNGKLVQNVSNNGNNQKWEVQAVSGSRYILRTKSTTCRGQIQNVNSTPQVKPSNYVYFSLYKNINDSTGQPDGTYRIHYAGSYWCLRVQNDSSVNNTSVIFDGYRKTSANNYNGSRWTFTKIS